MGIYKIIAWEVANQERREKRKRRKRRAVMLYLQGRSVESIAAKLGVKPSTVYRYLREWRQEGRPNYADEAQSDGGLLDIVIGIVLSISLIIFLPILLLVVIAVIYTI